MQDRKTSAAVIAVQLGVIIVTWDISLTSTALPAIAMGLGAAPASTIWIVNAYYLSVVAALLPLATLGEIYGHRRIFIGGLLVFALGSVAAGFADSLLALSAARAVVGLGSAAVSATTPALIRALYPPERLARGLGLYALVVGIAFSIGPTTTSTILSVASWPWLFRINDRSGRPFDAIAATLCAVMLASFVFGVASVAHGAGWDLIGPAWLASAICAAALVRRERGASAPIMATDLFRIPLFALSSATSICAFTVQGLVFVVLPFLLQFKLGYSQVEAGFLITPWPVTLMATTLVAAPLADKVPVAFLGGIGLLLVGAGLVTLETLPASAAAFDIGWRLAVCGIGFGFFQSPNMKAMMSSAPANRSGSAGGILAASRLLGQSFGAAAVAICLSLSPREGIDIALWAGVTMAMLGSIASFLRLLPSARAGIG